MDKKEKELRSKLLMFLDGHQAHMTFEDAIKDFPKKHINTKPKNVEYSFWHILEHIRITQKDILNFIEDENYEELDWPRQYWPGKNEITDWKGWEKTIKEFKKDYKKVKQITKDPKANLHKKIPWGDGQTILREILLIIDHNSYHIGEFAILRQVEGLW